MSIPSIGGNLSVKPGLTTGEFICPKREEGRATLSHEVRTRTVHIVGAAGRCFILLATTYVDNLTRDHSSWSTSKARYPAKSGNIIFRALNTP
jgi:hypothetical protein